MNNLSVTTAFCVSASILHGVGSALLLIGAATAQACQPFPLTSIFPSQATHPGIMFDLRATTASGVTICGFEIDSRSASGMIEIYTVTSGGTYVGNETNSSNWTLLGSRRLTSDRRFNYNRIALDLNVAIAPLSRRGFYVTFSDGARLHTAGGTALGALVQTDGSLEVLAGLGVNYPFAATAQPRVWVGMVHYCLGSGLSCSPTALPPFESNSGPSSLQFGGTIAYGNQPAVTPVCVGQTATLTASTTLQGPPSEIALIAGGLAPGPLAPARLTGSGQQVFNLDLASPSLRFLFGNTIPTWTPHPGSLNIPVASAAPLMASAQQIVLNPASTDGFDLSQGVTLDVTATSSSFVAPLGNDTAFGFCLTDWPLCLNSSIPFYGTTYTEIFLISNGRLTFQFGDSNPFPTPFDAAQSSPMIGVWSDFDLTRIGSSVTVSINSIGELQVDFIAVPYIFSRETATFRIAIQPITGQIALSGLSSVQVDSLLSPQLIGISPGGIGSTPAATNPGPVDFTVGNGFTTNASDMIYRFGTAGTLTTNGTTSIDTIVFLPNSFGNYDWIAF